MKLRREKAAYLEARLNAGLRIKVFSVAGKLYIYIYVSDDNML